MYTSALLARCEFFSAFLSGLQNTGCRIKHAKWLLALFLVWFEFKIEKNIQTTLSSLQVNMTLWMNLTRWLAWSKIARCRRLFRLMHLNKTPARPPQIVLIPQIPHHTHVSHQEVTQVQKWKLRFPCLHLTLSLGVLSNIAMKHGV